MAELTSFKPVISDSGVGTLTHTGEIERQRADVWKWRRFYELQTKRKLPNFGKPNKVKQDETLIDEHSSGTDGYS